MSSASVSSVSKSDFSDSDFDLPEASRPKKRLRKMQKRKTKSQRNETTVRWSSQVRPVREETEFVGYTHRDQVGESPELPMDVTPSDYF